MARDVEIRRWTTSWDRMQASYIPGREARFDAMFDLLEERLPRRFVALDLGSGPGPLARRLLKRFPAARCVALDYDPLLLELGRRTTTGLGKRLAWVEADLRSPSWAKDLPFPRFDAILSTTALHWLSREQLGRVYRGVHQILRPSGIPLNGDKAILSSPVSPLDRLLSASLHREQRECLRGHPERDWSGWWKAIGNVRKFRPLLVERMQRFPPYHEHDYPASEHLRGLRRAGFSSAEVVWRDRSNVILAALP